MSKYIKLDDAINAYNQAVKELVEKEMDEFDLCHFTECSFNTTQIMLIAQRIESLPTIEVSERVGKWSEVDSWNAERHAVTDMKCSECNKYASLVLPLNTTCTYPYCPNCGAKMEK